MAAPRFLVTLLASLFLASGASATPISPGAIIPGSAHIFESHLGVDGSNADISSSTFFIVDLDFSTFIDTNFAATTFTFVGMDNMDATDADFTGAALTAVSLVSSTLVDASFDSAVIIGNVDNATFDGASFLAGADISGITNWATASWNGALFDATTVLPAGFDPFGAGMVFVAEPHTAALMGFGLLGLCVYGRPRRS